MLLFFSLRLVFLHVVFQTQAQRRPGPGPRQARTSKPDWNGDFADARSTESYDEPPTHAQPQRPTRGVMDGRGAYSEVMYEGVHKCRWVNGQMKRGQAFPQCMTLWGGFWRVCLEAGNSRVAILLAL